MLDGLVEAGLEERQRWQFSEVFTDADGFGIQLEEFHLFGIGCGTENEADGGFLRKLSISRRMALSRSRSL